MKMAVFSVLAPHSLVDVLEALDTSVITVMNASITTQTT